MKEKSQNQFGLQNSGHSSPINEFLPKAVKICANVDGKVFCSFFSFALLFDFTEDLAQRFENKKYGSMNSTSAVCDIYYLIKSFILNMQLA